MAANSKIEWTDHTWNPWIGCAKVSPGCANCYAAAQDAFRKWTPEGWGPGRPRKRTSAANWRLPLKWNREAAKAGRSVRPSRVFCASLADWLDDEVPVEWLADLLGLIHVTPWLDWLLLTKRPENFQDRVGEAADFMMRLERDDWWVFNWTIHKNPPANVWIGTTVENQEMADKRIPELLRIPARVRFLSCEPLLGTVDLTNITGILHNKPFNLLKPDGCAMHAPGYCLGCCVWRRPALHWVICGGESGPKARPMHPDWARSLRDQCAAAGVPFLFKQWGEWSPGASEDYYSESNPLICLKVSGEDSWVAGDADTTINCSENYEETDQPMERVGKNAAGRLLDWVEHNAFPAPPG